MIKEVLLPDLGEGIEGAEVSEVSVSVGEKVQKDDTILVLESDKASMEIPAEIAGVVEEILVESGDEVTTGQLLIKVRESDEKSTSSTKEPSKIDVIKEVLLTDLGEGIEGAEVSEVSVADGE